MIQSYYESSVNYADLLTVAIKNLFDEQRLMLFQLLMTIISMLYEEPDSSFLSSTADKMFRQ